ncbi:hypothetical protein [Chondromyces apiculatus]|uniref:PEGA domain-containing protein n=1 Tax=Chondromyces apiculatus DSM 436 TaxID=1192034 RepID=A0A017T0M8_9BACT|nr:hypothetical protein [Chondromyces apiculatus]EYF02420.1 Hypothetical protein CAP_7191 [Chondromyces apiculatus DSM 436]
MVRVSAMAALAAAFLATAGVSAAPDAPQTGQAPDAAQVRRAAAAFDAGVAAFKERELELAASRFEEADAAVPSPQALRQAIRARQEAGQGSRAATLAALAIQRYPADEATSKLANEVLAAFGPSLHKLSVSCAPPCVVAVGSRAIHGEATTRWVVYLDPQPTTLSASFLGGSSRQVEVDAKAGGSSELRLEPEAGAPSTGGGLPGPSGGAGSVGTGAKTSPGTDGERPARGAPAVDVAATEPSKRGGLPPFVFFGGVAATAVLGGVTIWSGIDTLNNPGEDAVRAGCVGQGTGCALYQEALGKETRTNVLLGVTAGVGVLTVVSALFTDWGSSGRGASTGRRRVEPIVTATGRGGFLGAQGTF